MRSPVSCAVAILLSCASARAATPPLDVPELARAVVEIGDERPHEDQAIQPIEAFLSNSISTRLSLTDPSATVKVKSVVHDAFAGVSEKTADATVDAYAANFTARELGDVLAFMKSPAGMMEKANLSLLKVEMSAALVDPSGNPAIEVDAMRAYDGASPTMRELIGRILKAQDFEAHTRKGYATLGVIMKTALQQLAVSPRTRQTSALQAAEDAN